MDRLTVTRTMRVRLIAIPDRLVIRGGVYTLRGPAGLAVGRMVHRAAAAPARPVCVAHAITLPDGQGG